MANDDRTGSPNARGRVLMLAPDPDVSGPVPGPIAKVAYRLADALRSAGWVVDAEQWGRHRRHEGAIRKVAGRASDLLRIRRRIRGGAYDLVFVHTTHDLRALLRDLALVLPSPSSVRWVVLIHGSHFRSGHPLFDAGARRLVRRASTVLLLSSAEVAEWSAFCPSGRYRRVANALAPVQGGAPRPGSVANFPGGSAPRPELLFAGRLIREKGTHELLEAFAQVRSRRSCHLTMAGEGPEMERLRARASQLGISDDVGFTGHLPGDELARAYGRACVLVLPSYSEGLPTVLLEGMAAGLPIVTTRIRGAADHLTEGENALFVPPRDADALARALEWILDDGGLRSTMRANNLRKAEEFAPQRVAEAYMQVFEEVMGGEGRR